MDNSHGRNSNVEILRFILMCFIFSWHILVHGYNLKMLGIDNFQFHGNFVIASFFLTLFVPATYCFVFISGYYGIKFKLRKLITMLLWCSIVSVFAELYQYIRQDITFHITDLLKSLLPITANKWWFMKDFIMLYILSPVLNEGFDRLQYKSKILVLSLLMFFSAAGIVLLIQNCGSNLIGLIMIYLLARFLKASKWGGGKFTVRNSFAIYIVAFLLLWICIFSMYMLSNNIGYEGLKKVIFPFLGYSNPLIILMAVSLFYIIVNLREYSNRLMNNILSSTIFVYLITETGGFILYTNIASDFDENIVSGIFKSIAIISICLLVGHVVMQITSYIMICFDKIIKTRKSI